MAKHSTNSLATADEFIVSVFDHFVGLAVKGLKMANACPPKWISNENPKYFYLNMKSKTDQLQTCF